LSHSRVRHSFPTRRSSDLFREGRHLGPRHAVAYPLVQTLVAEAGEKPRIEQARPPAAREVGPMTGGACSLEDRAALIARRGAVRDRKSTRLNSSHVKSSYA